MVALVFDSNHSLKVTVIFCPLPLSRASQETVAGLLPPEALASARKLL